MPVVGAALSRLLAETSEADEGEEQEAHRDADADGVVLVDAGEDEGDDERGDERGDEDDETATYRRLLGFALAVFLAASGLAMATGRDKAPPAPGRPVDDIFLHNADWEVNGKRRPMYLTQIHTDV